MDRHAHTLRRDELVARDAVEACSRWVRRIGAQKTNLLAASGRCVDARATWSRVFVMLAPFDVSSCVAVARMSSRHDKTNQRAACVRAMHHHACTLRRDGLVARGRCGGVFTMGPPRRRAKDKPARATWSRVFVILEPYDVSSDVAVANVVATPGDKPACGMRSSDGSSRAHVAT